MNQLLPLAAALPLLAAPSLALGGVGDPLPTPEFEDFQQTEAKSFDDFVGRAVLIEFFEYW